MNQQTRLVLATFLMLAVLVGSNLLFGPAPPPDETGEESGVEAPLDSPDAGQAGEGAPPAGDPGADPQGADPQGTDPQGVQTGDPALPPLDPQEGVPGVTAEEEGELPAPPPERTVRVEGPLYDVEFTTLGARATSFELTQFESFQRPGPVQLVADPDLGMLGSRLVVSGDTVDLRGVSFEAEPAGGVRLEAGGEPQTLTFTYQHPTEPFAYEISYRFDPDSYQVGVSGRVRGLERALLLTDLGRGLAYNESDPGDEAQQMAYVANHLQEGVDTEELSGIEGPILHEGPFLWAALKSRYFVVALLPSGEPGATEYFGGILANPLEMDERTTADVAVAQSLSSGGRFDFRVFAGPQEYQLMAAIGEDFQEVNPVGWSFIRPILRPFVGAITWVLHFLHDNLNVGYGWVLIIFGVSMRILLFPLNHKAMRAQLRNMAVQPLLKDIQTKYKDQPEKMQKELMKLYKEHGFNPLAGCWPMLLPWPVLIALFFVFQNTIELRGVPFAWLTDLSAKDPYFILPVLLAVSMFLMQWISLRTMEEANPQMKMMMYFMPIMMLVIFSNLPSGLNLYYLTANLATLPQSWWIANERKKVRAKGPPVMSEA